LAHEDRLHYSPSAERKGGEMIYRTLVSVSDTTPDSPVILRSYSFTRARPSPCIYAKVAGTHRIFEL
jgi:hypothetical protein